MASSNAAVPARSAPAPLVLILTIVGALALWFVATAALRYAQFDEATYGRYWPRRLGLAPHVAGGTVALLAGLAQLWLGLTGRTGALHRRIGRVYLAAIAVGSVAGFYLAVTGPAGALAFSSGLFMLCVAWVITTTMAWHAIRHRAIEQHREWMLRSYVVTFGFVTFRAAEQALIALGATPDYQFYGMIAWGCWAVPLLLAEPLLQRRKVRRR